MTTATAIVGGVSAIGGLIGGASQAAEGRKMQRKAQGLIDNFKWKDLGNPYKALSVDTTGAEMELDSLDSFSATVLQNLRMGGNRSLGAGLMDLQRGRNDKVNSIIDKLNKEREKLNFAAAGADMNIQAMEEKRQTDEIAAYGNMLSVGMGMKQQGMGNMIGAGTALGQIAGSGAFGGGGGSKPSGQSYYFGTTDASKLYQPFKSE